MEGTVGHAEHGSVVEYPDIFGAIMSDDIDAVEAMLAADPRRASRHDGRSPILLAAYRHRRDVLVALLRRDPPLDPFEAAATGATDTLRSHLLAQPDVAQAYSEDGLTALHLAAFFGHAEAARDLIARGARPGALAHNDSEQTPLHLAVVGGHDEVVQVLLEHGAPVDAQEQGGVAPLHTAARRGDVGLVQLLLAHGARIDIETDAGKTAADLAYEFEHDALAATLRPTRM
ncbi:MAG: ankyrin repeat domain-containing protein [Dehalococcoidia bacterium]